MKFNKWGHSINSHIRYILGYVKIILYAIGDGMGANLMKISTISILSGIAK